jgi:hypothetical protein
MSELNNDPEYLRGLVQAMQQQRDQANNVIAHQATILGARDQQLKTAQDQLDRAVKRIVELQGQDKISAAENASNARQQNPEAQIGVGGFEPNTDRTKVDTLLAESPPYR